MRTAFIDTLLEMAAEDERIVLLTADLGWNVVERFAREFPERFLNLGVAEANMAGVATGLALEGHVPFLYSIATFASMRCYEQVRNGPLLHRLPIRVVGIGGGYAYGHAGPTHYGLEDLALARTQPGMTVLAPADPLQTRQVVRATATLEGPAYLRIGKGGNPEVPGLNGRFALGRPEVVRPGHQILLLVCGSIAHEALAAAVRLQSERVSAAVAVMAHLPFAPTRELLSLLAEFAAVVTVEEGFATGGLGSLVAEAIAREGLKTRLATRGVCRSFEAASGSEAYMRRQNGVDAASVAVAARELLSIAPG